MKFFYNKYFLLGVIVFFGAVFFVSDTIAANCPPGKVGTCVQGAVNCPPERSIGTCDDGMSTCCAPVIPPPPPAGSCPTGEVCESPCPKDSEPTGKICGEGLKQCCKSKQLPAGSCSGGSCVKSGDPCPSGTKADGACSSAEGGGTCCKNPIDSGGGGNMVSIKFENPLAYDTVEGVLDSILDTIRAIIVTLALVFLVVGAVLYITSAGNDGMMKMAKGAITAAMIGLAIGLAAPSFLREISSVLGWTSVNNSEVEQALTLSEIALNVLHFLLSVVGILAIIMLVVGGIMYLTSAGSEDRAETGKKIVFYSIIGIFVALASLVIVSQIAEFFM